MNNAKNDGINVKVVLTTWLDDAPTTTVGIFKDIKNEPELFKYVGEEVGGKYEDLVQIRTVTKSNNFKYSSASRYQDIIENPRIEKTIEILFSHENNPENYEIEINRLFGSCKHYKPTNEQ